MSAKTIEKTCAVTMKGQTTLPLWSRELLNVARGGRIRVRSNGEQVVLEPVAKEDEHFDPAIAAFLSLIEKDIATRGAIKPLSDEMHTALEEVLADVDVDLSKPIEGDVCL